MNKKKKKPIQNIFSQKFVKKPAKLTPSMYLKLGLISLSAFVITIFLYQKISMLFLTNRFNQQKPLSLKYDPIFLKQQIKENRLRVSLIDIREKSIYKQGHIWGAVNIVWQNNAKQFLADLKKLKLKERTVVVYEHSGYSVKPEELVNYLRKAGIDAYYLSIGYNEWRNFHTFWLPEKEWDDFKVENYIQPSR